jgi:hypothetical protein
MARDVAGPGLPIAFPVKAPAREPVTVEAAITGGHQKEALVYAGGAVWRLASDEGPYLKGTDLAPAPLMYWAAGVHAELTHRIAAAARAAHVSLSGVSLEIVHGYALSGSFFEGTAKGQAFAPEFEVKLEGSVSADQARTLAAEAAGSSPVLAAMRRPLANTFALYTNGRRCAVSGVPASGAPDAADPFLAHAAAPAPLALPEPPAIEKGAADAAAGNLTMPSSTSGVRFASRVAGRLDAASGLDRCVVTFPGIPSTPFTFAADAGSARAPSGVAYCWAGVAFCYLTQLTRYIETKELGVSGARLVQHGPPEGPVDTHLFLNGAADDATMQKLLAMGAHTCYLHATLAAVLEPVLR